tara:strand:+ start:8736 stop:10442 length:1707 start_codon:yes stop_codon:yes gene_type:complete
MVKILGIKYGGHDTSAALLIDGKIVAASAQERYTRDKHSRKFPKEAVEDCLKLANTKIDEIDEIAFVNDVNLFIREMYLKPALKNDDRLNFFFNDLEKLSKIYNFKSIIKKELKYNGVIKNYKHHLCHIASSYFSSGFENSLCLSIDGFGEHETGLLVSAEKGKLKILNNENVYPHSLGLAYSAITFFLGWKHHCDEGIIMGLAPYGNSKNIIPGRNKSYIDIFREILIHDEDFKFKVNEKFLDYYSQRDKWVTSEFIEIFGSPRRYNDKIEQHHKDIAAALQDRLEEIVLKFLRKAKEKYKLNNLCLAGGVALNCSMNGKIEKNKLFDEIFVVPPSGDDGTAIGACYLAYQSRGEELNLKKNYNFYLGSKFTNNEIKNTIKESNLNFEENSDIFKTTAKYILDGKIIAWFQGGAEFGPRALGNRSILCKPYPKEMKDYLNKQVKFREDFRPFAPAVLKEFQQDYFEINQDSPHMLIACNVKESKNKIIPAVVHVDGSCRVQTVTQDTNERFYFLIKEFYKLSNIPVILNTSFNIKGQPIVNNPKEAIDTFKNTNIDVLVIGDYILTK